jgi:hydroxymethylpyrimidine/phosphomethylpyrimidine kinase
MEIHKKFKYAVVLTIAGSDSGGGAGIQADLKTFSALGCFGTSAITAVTAQNTMGVTSIHSIPANMVYDQISAVMDDLRPGAIKIGMVHTAALANVIADVLVKYPEVPVIFDPVMVSTSGFKLIEDNTIETLKLRLFPIATLVTPNLDEASLLCGKKIESLQQMMYASKDLLLYGSKAVLVKGGHLKGPVLHDVYCNINGSGEVFNAIPVITNNTHGTGCTLSSAIAAYLALGHELHNAIILSRQYVQSALAAGASVTTGKGPGPLNHFFNPEKLSLYEMD